MDRQDALFHAATLFIAAQNTAGLDDRKRQIVVSAAFDLAELTVAEQEKRIAAQREAEKAAAAAETPPAP